MSSGPRRRRCARSASGSIPHAVRCASSWRSCVSRRRERGVALVAAVTALALMTAIAVAVARTTAVDQRLARDALLAIQADALARSGIAVATVALQVMKAGGSPDTQALDVG